METNNINYKNTIKLSSLDDSICYEIPSEIYFPIMKVLFAVKGAVAPVNAGVVEGVPVTRLACLRSRNFGLLGYRRLLGALARVEGVKVISQTNVNRLLEEDNNN